MFINNLFISIKKHWLLILIILVGTFLRFYNLDWGSGYFFHPDERNIANAVTSLNFVSGDFNPDFFAYGALPIYLIRLFSGDNFDRAVIVGRILSALFSSLSLILIYLISSKIFENSRKEAKNLLSFCVVVLCSFSPGLIQFAHFMTFETFLTFLYLLVIFFSLKILEKDRARDYFFTALFLGMSVAVKIISLALIPIPFLIKVINSNFNLKKFGSSLMNFFDIKYLIASIVVIFSSIVFSPFNLIDSQGFIDSMNYEGPVADGSLLVFYTEQFLDTIPVFYQFTRVFPYIIGWPLTLISLLGFLYLILNFAKKIISSPSKVFDILLNEKIFLIIIFIILYGGFHFTLFVKWTRYMIPLIPFLVIISVYFLDQILSKYKVLNKFLFPILIFITGFSIFLGINHFWIYTQNDPRIEAATWIASRSVNPGAKIFFEPYDLGTMPFHSLLGYENMTDVNFYELENGGEEEVDELVKNSDYFVMLSNRVFPTRMRLKEQYPKGYNFYNSLFEGELGYEKVAEFRRESLLESIFGWDFDKYLEQNYWTTPDETFNVFDNPTVVVYQRN